MSASGEQELRGIAGAPGLAVGTALVVSATERSVPRRAVRPESAPGELDRFRKAVGRVQSELRDMAKRLADRRAEESILEAYTLMVADDVLDELVRGEIEGRGRNAEWAVASACAELATRFATLDDAYLRERGHDVDFVCDRLLSALTGSTEEPLPKLSEPTVVVARDLSPADTAAMAGQPVVAIVTEVGSRTSHTAIMARALGIAAVVGAQDALRHVRSGDLLIVDGQRGRVHVSPSTPDVEAAHERVSALHERTRRLRGATAATTTACGRPVALRANVELPSEAERASLVGAQGIGLYRTEFLYVDRLVPPSEDEQADTFRRVIEQVSPQPVTLRTFDLGGDKFASTFQVPPELNPMLGLRAVRLALSRRDVFRAHLRAMVRASAHGDVRVMVPMVSGLEELREVRAMLDEARREVAAQGLPQAEHLPLGVMIEVPGAAVLADRFAREAAFLSLGTNDLVQYALAVDRTSRSLAYLASPYHPAILRLVDGVVRAGAEHGKPVSICGAMASEPLAFLLLLGLGVRDFSMEPGAIPTIREALRGATLEELEGLAREALSCGTAHEVERLLTEALGARLEEP